MYVLGSCTSENCLLNSLAHFLTGWLGFGLSLLSHFRIPEVSPLSAAQLEETLERPAFRTEHPSPQPSLASAGTLVVCLSVTPLAHHSGPTPPFSSLHPRFCSPGLPRRSLLPPNDIFPVPQHFLYIVPVLTPYLYFFCRFSFRVMSRPNCTMFKLSVTSFPLALLLLSSAQVKVPNTQSFIRRKDGNFMLDIFRQS